MKKGDKLPNHQNEESGISQPAFPFEKKQSQTRHKLAKEYGVSPTTIRRDAKFVKGLENLPLEIKEFLY